MAKIVKSIDKESPVKATDLHWFPTKVTKAALIS